MVIPTKNGAMEPSLLLQFAAYRPSKDATNGPGGSPLKATNGEFGIKYGCFEPNKAVGHQPNSETIKKKCCTKMQPDETPFWDSLKKCDTTSIPYLVEQMGPQAKQLLLGCPNTFDLLAIDNALQCQKQDYNEGHDNIIQYYVYLQFFRSFKESSNDAVVRVIHPGYHHSWFSWSLCVRPLQCRHPPWKLAAMFCHVGPNLVSVPMHLMASPLLLVTFLETLRFELDGWNTSAASP